jgi:hypothetical protein
MRSWLHPRAFLTCALLMLVLRLTRIPTAGIDGEWLGATIAQVVLAGVFWGAIATYIYNRFYKR